MSKNSKFMDIYRRFESAIKSTGKYSSVKEYEESLSENSAKQGQIRMCRMIRNYIEHENASFVEASDSMISFLEKETCELDENEMPVKKKMLSIKNAIKETDLIVIASDFMTKKKQPLIPVFNKDDFATGVISYEAIVKMVASGDFTKAKKVSLIFEQHKFGFFKETEPMKNVRPLLEGHKKVYLILNDSKKVAGWII